MKNRIKVLMLTLGILALLVSALSMLIPVAAVAPVATPAGANLNNVQMSLAAIPSERQVGQNITFFIVVTNPSAPAIPPGLVAAHAQNLTVTFFPAGLNGTPSPTGVVIGNITYLAVDAPAVVFGPFVYAMPDLDPGVTVANYRAVLNGTILLSPPQPFHIEKFAGVTLIDWTIAKSGSVAAGSVNVAGETITYTVVVNNTGGAWLQGNLTDSLPGISTITGPVESILPNGQLQPGETWTYTYYYNATQSDIDNNGINAFGVADGDGDIDNIATFTDNFGNSKSDDASVPILLNPVIDIEKLVNGVDADIPPGPTVAVNSTVTFTFNVTNTGNVALTNIVVTDNVLGHIGNISSLAPGASHTFTRTALASAGNNTNVGNVTSAQNATDRDDGNYHGTTILEGCSPGFWKNNAARRGAVAWVPTGYSPTQRFSTVFNVTITVRQGGRRTVTDPTLLQALRATGGGVNALARHAVAGLLNAAHPDIDYGIPSAADVIALVRNALLSNNLTIIGDLASQLAFFNERGCPI